MEIAWSRFNSPWLDRRVEYREVFCNPVALKTLDASLRWHDGIVSRP